MNTVVAITGCALPALIAVAGKSAKTRFIEFFTANTRNPNTRRAYARAEHELLTWCYGIGVSDLLAVAPLHVATWIELQTQTLAAPTVKQRLAAIRHLFDWLMVGHRDHQLPEKRRNLGERGGDGQLCFNPDHKAVRPAPDISLDEVDRIRL